MGIKARRVRRKPGGSQGVFEDEDEPSSVYFSARYAAHRAHVERDQSRRRQKGGPMDWLIFLVGWFVSLLATALAGVIHALFPVAQGRSGAGDDRWRQGRGKSEHARRNNNEKTRRDWYRGEREDSRDKRGGSDEHARHKRTGSGNITDPFLVLGCDRNESSLDDVARAFRRAARKHHPDKNRSDADEDGKNETMQTINAARVTCVAEIKRRTAFCEEHAGGYAAPGNPPEQPAQPTQTRVPFNRVASLALWTAFVCAAAYNQYDTIKRTATGACAYVCYVVGGFSTPDWVLTLARWRGSGLLGVLGVVAVLTH